MIELRPAPRATVRAIRRRLAKSTPAAHLIADSVKHVPVPDTRFDAAFFIFELHNVFHFVTEICVPGFPHIFHSFTAKNDNARDNLENLLVSVIKLRERVHSDPAFTGGNGSIIQLNGARSRMEKFLRPGAMK